MEKNTKRKGQEPRLQRITYAQHTQEEGETRKVKTNNQEKYSVV